MLKYIIITLHILILVINYGQSQVTPRGFSTAINSSFNGEFHCVRIVPSVIYSEGNNQFELGVGFNPFTRQTQKQLSGEFNYKYFPNGSANKFNMYLMMSFAYINQLRKTYYPATYHYLFLHGGYGFQIRVSKRMYIGTNINIGTFTNSKASENPYEKYSGAEKLFDEFGVSLACQLNFGYHFK